MSFWEALEQRVRERGVRVEERLALIDHLRRADGEASLAQERQRLLRGVDEAARRVREALP